MANLDPMGMVHNGWQYLCNIFQNQIHMYSPGKEKKCSRFSVKQVNDKFSISWRSSTKTQNSKIFLLGISGSFSVNLSSPAHLGVDGDNLFAVLLGEIKAALA